MMAPSVEELATFKYSELRKLAKAAGLKANLKADRLLRTLKKHFHPAVVTENSSSDSDGNSTLTDDTQGSLDDAEQVSICHVTHRRGQGKKAAKASSSPKINNEATTIQGGGVGNDTEETSTNVMPNQQNEDEVTRESKDDIAKITRRRSKRNPSSGRKRHSKIPKKDTGSKPSTPNFKRMHEAHFKKMESIDKYLERKQKRLAIGSSIQDVKMLTKNSNQKTPGSYTKKSSQSRFSLLSPAPQTGLLFSAKTPSNTRSAGKRSILVDKSGAKPSICSSSKMNVRFSGATKDNEHKYSLVKTPARKSSTFAPNSEPRKSLPHSSIKNMLATEETKISEAITPFKFNAENMATPNTSKKTKFDLQASLARPLAYQPHRGKLKPWGDTKENTEAVQSKSSTLKNSYKQPHLSSSRDNRRKGLEKDRKSKRDKTIGSRRGVAVP